MLEDDYDLVMGEGQRELSVLSDLLKKIDAEKSKLLGKGSLRKNVINQAAIESFKGIIPDSQKLSVLEELSYRAYGKVVCLKDSSNNLLYYRLAQANWSMIDGIEKKNIMVINRLAHVAGLLAPAAVGDPINLPNVGDCVVISVDLLDRYQRGQRDNFSLLEYQDADHLDEGSRLVINDVKKTIAQWSEDSKGYISDILLDAQEVRQDVFTADSNASLGANFYTRTTHLQEEIIRRPPRGLVLVEGIAGSGKTSVALGRVKLLHDLNTQSEDDDRDEFFEDQSQMVGFVLHNQLIQYLSQTLTELNLPRMRVREFKELQKDLILQRGGLLRLKMPGNPRGTYQRKSGVTSFPFEHKMCWLSAVEKNITLFYLERVKRNLKQYQSQVESKGWHYILFNDVHIDYKALSRIVWSEVMDKFENLHQSVINTGDGKYYSQKIVHKLHELYKSFFNRISEHARWYYYNNKWHTERSADHVLLNPIEPFFGRQFDKKDQDWLKKYRSDMRTLLRQALLLDNRVEHMPDLSGWYKRVLENGQLENEFDASDIGVIQSRVSNYKLADTDLNLLLSIAHLMSDGHFYEDDDQTRIAAYLASPPFYTTVFIDEVQDFSEMEVFLMAEQADPRRRAVTAVGDFKQQLYTDKVEDLSVCFPSSTSSELQILKLDENKRQIKTLANYSARFRAKIEGKDFPNDIPEPVFGDELTEEEYEHSDFIEVMLDYITNTPHNQSIAVIFPTDDLAQKYEDILKDHIVAGFRESQYSSDSRDLNKEMYVHFTTPKPTKGLEFDVVIAPCFNEFDLSDRLQAHAAYVTVTRPRNKLHIINVLS